MKRQKENNCKCIECGKEFYRKPSQINENEKNFCSHTCSNIRFKIIHKCPVCGKEILKGAHAITCSRRCSNIRRKGIKYKEGNLDSNKKAVTKKELRIRYIKNRGGKCNRCGYDYIYILQIHHIIEKAKGGSDDENNLEILCPNCHILHHHLTRTKMESNKGFVGSNPTASANFL